MANKTFDELGLIVEDAAITTTASATGVNINGLSVGSASYVAVIANGAVTGTVDGSNYYTVKLEASDAVGGTYVQVGNTVALAATAGEAQIGFTSEQLNGLVSGADYFRVTTTKVGTTATAVTVSAFISKV
jgi:hypothetical protein